MPTAHAEIANELVVHSYEHGVRFDRKDDFDLCLDVLMSVHQWVTPAGMVAVSKPANQKQFAGTVEHSLKLTKIRVLLHGEKRTGLPRTVNQ